MIFEFCEGREHHMFCNAKTLQFGEVIRAVFQGPGKLNLRQSRSNVWDGIVWMTLIIRESDFVKVVIKPIRNTASCGVRNFVA